MKEARISCHKCLITSCNLCGPYYFKREVPVAPFNPAPFFPSNLILEQQYYISWCQGEIERLKREVLYYKRLLADVEMEKELSEDFRNLRIHDTQRGKAQLELIPEEDEEEFANILYADVTSKPEQKDNQVPKLVKNLLFNLKVEIDLPGIPRFGLRAILDRFYSSLRLLCACRTV